MDVADRSDREKERGGYKTVYRLPKCYPIDEADGISHAPYQRFVAGSGQSAIVLFTGDGQRILGCRDDVKSTNNLCFYYALRSLWMVTHAFRAEESSAIYRRMVDTALYRYLTIGDRRKSSEYWVSKQIDVFTDGEPNPHQSPSVLGRRSCIDDTLIPASSCTSLHQKVDRLLEVCDQWNLSISYLPKSG